LRSHCTALRRHLEEARKPWEAIRRRVPRQPAKQEPHVLRATADPHMRCARALASPFHVAAKPIVPSGAPAIRSGPDGVVQALTSVSARPSARAALVARGRGHGGACREVHLGLGRLMRVQSVLVRHCAWIPRLGPSRAGFMSEMALCDATAFAARVHRPPARAAHRPSLLCLGPTARSMTHESGVVH
jgi:hypothetical protein